MRKAVAVSFLAIALIAAGCSGSRPSTREAQPESEEQTVQCPRCGTQFKIFSW